eukprot:6176242-Pleurochrysis_carterae.AAC.1
MLRRLGRLPKCLARSRLVRYVRFACISLAVEVAPRLGTRAARREMQIPREMRRRSAVDWRSRPPCRAARRRDAPIPKPENVERARSRHLRPRSGSAALLRAPTLRPAPARPSVHRQGNRSKRIVHHLLSAARLRLSRYIATARECIQHERRSKHAIHSTTP